MKALKISFPSGRKYLKALLLGIIAGALITAVLLAVCAVILSKAGFLPTDYLWIAIALILFSGSFCGGYVSARIYRAKGLLLGIIAGLTLFLILTLSGAASSAGKISVFSLYKALALTAGGAVGGIIGVNKSDRIKIK